jgi:hypothetical protein
MGLKMITFNGGSLPDKYCFGFVTGPDKDLICTKPCKTNEEAEDHLSPIALTRIGAIYGFLFLRGE